MISRVVSHYRILSKLGAGAMGEVYLAEDMRLGRKVALKLLPASYTYDPNRKTSFLKEARTVSALRSPNIAAIYDIGEHEDSIFIVMEYVEGETLTQKLKRGPIDVQEAVEIAAQIADALDEAHTLGTIHCDIKSSNLIINERRLVKILDFGIARAPEPESIDDDSDRTVEAGQQTAMGVVLGAPSYLSPEQAMGRQPDHRSDIFSSGVVLYEMLSGRLPFEGENSAEIVNSALHREAPSVTRFNYSVPPDLERIVRKCLEKDPDRRYQSAKELLIDLRNFQRDSKTARFAMAAAAATTPITRRPRARKAIDSLAILPLVNESADPSAEYLSDGITESIINNLSRLPRLKVMARSTVFRYKDRESDPLEVGRTLGVRAVLTGRLLQREDMLIVRTELVDAVDGAHLWGEQYNRRLSDIFSIEEEIAREISDKLRLKLSGEDKKRLGKRHTANPAAYQHYLRGRYYWNKRTEEGLQKGIEHFHNAVGADPNYALAYAGLADSYVILTGYSSMLPEEVFPVAKAAAMKALRLDEALPEAHTSLAAVRFWYEWDWAGAERAFKRAIELNPGYATALLWYALELAALERLDEAVITVKQAQERDPLSLIINLNVARILFFAREYEKAVEQSLKVIEMDVNFSLAYRRLAQTYEQMGRHDAAIAEFQKALSLSESNSETMSALAHAFALSGNPDRARSILDKLMGMQRDVYISPYSIARIHAGLGENDQAFQWLEKAREERHSILVYLKVEQAFSNLHSDPRFADLLRRMNLAG